MKHIQSIVLIIGIVLGLNSCCTKKECIDSGEIYEINFYNFSPDEIDSIMIYSYSKNSNFNLIIDSSFSQASLNGDYSTAYISNRINTDFDYEVLVLSTGQVITLTGFEVEKKRCNSCFPYRPESDYYEKLNSYFVNGQKQSGSIISIYK
ncbi:MAG: hypothetical protein RLZZ543_2134 [Bacteroidota bacterium]|jgi:hypothetical protein